MPDLSPQSAELRACFERMAAGDPAAREELFRRVRGRLEELARRMLRGFPNVRRWADSDDVLQNALVRLLRTLETIHPSSVREFLNLSALEIRRELLDLARRFAGPGKVHFAADSLDAEGSAGQPRDPVTPPEELERWTRFHEEVERLPAEEREVVGLLVYHGWTQAQAAEQLGVSDRTVRRRWESAALKLHVLLREKSGP
jgi:RNA polymerase sigma-70 factor (ECF subfamily)